MTNFNTTEFTDAIGSTDGLLAVDIWASWCGPCRILGPMYEKVSEELSDKATFAKYQLEDENLDYFKSNHADFEVRGIPTILFFKGGELVDRHVGMTDQNSLKEKVEGLL